MPRAFDYEKNYTYKDKFGVEHVEYCPMRYFNGINTTTPSVSGTWVYYGIEGSSKADSNNCLVEITNGVILNSGSLFSRQISCEPHAYNAGNYYNYPAARQVSTADGTICAKGWTSPRNTGLKSHGDLLKVYGIDSNASKVKDSFDAAIINLPFSYMRSGFYHYHGGSLSGRGTFGYYRNLSTNLFFGNNNYSTAYNLDSIYGYSLRCGVR